MHAQAPGGLDTGAAQYSKHSLLPSERQGGFTDQRNLPPHPGGALECVQSQRCFQTTGTQARGRQGHLAALADDEVAAAVLFHRLATLWAGLGVGGQPVVGLAVILDLLPPLGPPGSAPCVLLKTAKRRPCCCHGRSICNCPACISVHPKIVSAASAMYWSHCCPESSAPTCPPGRIIPSVNTQPTHQVLRAHNTPAHACWETKSGRRASQVGGRQPMARACAAVQDAHADGRVMLSVYDGATGWPPSKGGCPQNVRCSTVQSS